MENLFIPDRQNGWSIHVQCYNCSAARARFANNGHTIPEKVIGSSLSARIEQSHSATRLRIRCEQVGFFSQRTRDARKRQVSLPCRAFVRHRNDVIDVESRFWPC